MNSDKDDSKFNSDSQGHSYGYSYGGGWDIDTSERTQRTSDGGHIPGRDQFEESVDVSSELFNDDKNDDKNDDSKDNDDKDTGCYLTTLMCELLGYEDDCFELTYLRNFRQNYMQNNIEGQKLLSQYKDISHPIVKKLRMRLDKKEIALKMKNDYITSAIEKIKNGNPEDGIAIYKDMVAYLQSL